MTISSDIIITAIASLSSAIIGGIIAFTGSWIATKKQINAKNEDNKEIETRFIRSIFIEIESIYSRYQELSHIIQNKYDFLDYSIYVNEDYFPVYHNNIGYLGLIENDELRNNIISFYTQAKGLIDTLRTNTKLLDDLKNSTSHLQKQNIVLALRQYLSAIKDDDIKTIQIYNKIQKVKKHFY